MDEKQILDSLGKIEEICTENNKQLLLLNGGQKRNTNSIKDLKQRVRDIEDDDVEHKGFVEGKKFMRASTKTILIVTIAIVTCMFAGIAVFKNDSNKTRREFKVRMHDRFTGEEGKQLLKRIEKLEQEG